MSASKKKAPAEKFWWFRGASVDQLRVYLAGVSSPRLEVHLDGDRMTLHVIPEATGPTEAGGFVNDSHVCPPHCP